MTAVHDWHTKQLDYVAVLPQAPVEREVYMKIPKGVDLLKNPHVITYSNYIGTPMDRRTLVEYGINT